MGGSPADRQEARRRLLDALRIFHEAQDVTGYALVLDGFSILALRDGDKLRGARLAGAVKSLERASGTGLTLWNREVLHFDVAELEADPEFAGEVRRGAALTADEAVAYALDQ